MFKPANLFSRRNNPQNQQTTYDLTEKVRFKVIRKIEEFNFENGPKTLKTYAGAPVYNENEVFVRFLEDELGREIPSVDYDSKIGEFFNNCTKNEFFDALELLLQLKVKDIDSFSGYFPELNERLDQFKTGLNGIFKVEGLNYEILEMSDPELPYMVQPIDSNYLHEETVKRPLSLMNDPNFGGPLNEFEKALKDYRNSSYKDAIRDASNAYESTLKAILTLKNVTYDEKKEKIVGLVEKVQNEAKILDNTTKPAFDSFWGILKNGSPTIRNQAGVGHGQGKNVKDIKKSYAHFVLSLIGTFIVFLIERFNETQ